jgi:hypothetical protein
MRWRIAGSLNVAPRKARNDAATPPLTIRKAFSVACPVLVNVSSRSDLGSLIRHLTVFKETVLTG